MTSRLILACAAIAVFGGPAMADQTEITRTLTDIAAGADRHDWTRVREAFADSVTTDYTSLWGGEPITQPADDLVAAWSAFLPGFDVTHHMVTNHTIDEASETQATAQADFTATHRIDDDLWVLGGRYDYALEMKDGRWVVTSLKMTALWETGDRALVETAGQRAASGD